MVPGHEKAPREGGARDTEMQTARALVYLFICCCGMVTFYIIVSHTAEHMSPDTVFGFIYGMFFTAGTLAFREWLKRREVRFSEQDDKVPARRL